MCSKSVFIDVTCIMSVYINDRVEWVAEAVNSIILGSVRPREFLIYCDGPICSEVNALLKGYAAGAGSLISLFKSDENRGRAYARQYLVQRSIGNFIMIMDSDDISASDRLEKQYFYMLNNPEIDVLGGKIMEFGEGVESRLRSVPLVEKEILSFGKFRQPLNHVTILAKKSALTDVGGYIDAGSCEDYYLIARWMVSGKHLRNLPDVLVNVRIDADFTKRRIGFSVFKDQIKVAHYLKSCGQLSVIEYIFIIFVKFLPRLLPESLFSFFYKHIRTPLHHNKDR